MNIFQKNVLIPSLSGLLYGYNSTIIASTLLFLAPHFSLTPFQEGALVGIGFLGTGIACFSAILATYFGRKKILMLSALLFIIGCLASALSPSYELLLVARVFVGFAIGIAIVVSPIYLVEVAPPDQRGRIVNLNQIEIALGSILAYLCGYLLAASGDWRLMFALGALPGIIQWVGFLFLSDSSSVKERLENQSEASWKAVFQKKLRSRLSLVVILSLFQSLSGSSIIFFFAPQVFQTIGFDHPQSSLLATTIIGLVYLLSILTSFWVIDHLGRRPLLFISFGGMALSYFVIVFCEFLSHPSIETITLVCLLAAVLFYGLGVGPVPPLVIGEISPIPLRGHFMTLMGITGWSTNYLIAITFPPLMARLGVPTTFSIYGLLCLIALLIFIKIFPETRSKSLEEIDHMYTK